MWLQYSVSIYQREGNCVINRAYTSMWQVVLNGADSFPYGDCVEQSLPFPLRVVFFVNGTSMNIVDNRSGSC